MLPNVPESADLIARPDLQVDWDDLWLNGFGDEWENGHVYRMLTR
jgi:hypothetical protein